MESANLFPEYVLFVAKLPWAAASQGHCKGGTLGASAPQCLAEQLTLSQPDYAHHSTTSPLKISDFATALREQVRNF